MKDNDNYSEEEVARRRDEIIRRMANTPPKPHRESSPKPARRKVDESQSKS